MVIDDFLLLFKHKIVYILINKYSNKTKKTEF